MMLRSDLAQAPKTQKQHKCLHEHWKNCQDYPEAHTWEARDQKDIEEEEAVRALVAAEDDSYLTYDEACRVRQFVTGSDLSNKSGGREGWNCPRPQHSLIDLRRHLETYLKLGGIRGPLWLFALYKSFKSFLSSEAVRFAQS
ncbi:hypothetical protein EI94DRAFT_1702908 [Lactarius quietus]|nr:hypothetical protein EI94DRAFT_1702908 [Lactarius quietus]